MPENWITLLWVIVYLGVFLLFLGALLSFVESMIKHVQEARIKTYAKLLEILLEAVIEGRKAYDEKQHKQDWKAASTNGEHGGDISRGGKTGSTWANTTET